MIISSFHYPKYRIMFLFLFLLASNFLTTDVTSANVPAIEKLNSFIKAKESLLKDPSAENLSAKREALNKLREALPELDDENEVFDVKFQTAFERIDQYHSGIIYMILRNKSEHEIAVQDFLVRCPPGVSVNFVKNELYLFSQEQRQEKYEKFKEKLSQMDDNEVAKRLEAGVGGALSKIREIANNETLPNKCLSMESVSHVTEQGQEVTKIPAFESRLFPFVVEIIDRIQPGNHLLVFQSLIEWKVSDKIYRRRHISSQNLALGIFGESEILQVLTLPTVLLLPGFMILIIMRSIWRQFSKEEKRDEFPFNPTSPMFWIASITLSAVMALGYAEVTRHNYLEAYGLVDLSFVWLFSLIAGIVFGSCFYKFYNSFLKRRDEKIAAKSSRV